MVGACPYPVPQGSQVYLRESALALKSQGHDVRLVTYGYGLGTDAGDLPLHRSSNWMGASKTAAGPSFAKPMLDASLVRTLRRVVREHKVDVVGAHNYEALLVALAARIAPVVYHAHNAMADELPYYFRSKRVARRFGRRLDRSFPRRATRVVVPHQALSEYLIENGCKKRNVSVVAPPLNADAFDTISQRDATVPQVLYTGNLDAYQNLPLLEDVVGRVREVMPSVKFNLATTSTKKVQGAEYILTPDFDTLRTTLASDAVFVCPRTSWSGYPIKLLNAMAAGLPIVCCASSAHPLRDGENGVVVPDDNAEAFAVAVIGLLKSPDERERLGAAARATVCTEHGPTHIGQQLEAVYDSALGR